MLKLQGVLPALVTPFRDGKVDETAFVAWAIDNAPDALSYRPKVSALKDMDRADDGHLVEPETGELVPGVVEVTADPTYSVKPATPEPEPF